MTYREALKEFLRRHGLTSPKAWMPDRPRIRQAWVETIDSLQRGGEITEQQARTWDNPFLPLPPLWGAGHRWTLMRT